jgi:hypothetical protein
MTRSENVMSRTDKTAPLWVAEARGDCPRTCGGGYPCKHISSSGSLAVLKRRYWRRDRTLLRSDLAHGIEPSKNQHRHDALWDLW